LLNAWYGGGATRPIPWDGGVEEFLGDQTVGPRPVSANISSLRRGGAVHPQV